ncbi:MAG: DUF1838 family protein [Gammaproteobacteria bacterium]|nr:DUF1838 family protein [Gammaproteobacteria bacterium]
MSVGRRELLRWAVLGAALTGSGSGALFARTSETELDSLTAHIRMRCDLSRERTYWFYTGTVFGNVIGQSTQAMLGVEGISYSLLEPLADGRYRYRFTEAGYYLDPTTHTLRERVVNPFTGKSYRPQAYLSGQVNVFAPDLSVTPQLEVTPPGLEYRGSISPLQTFANTAWSSEDLFVRLPNPSAAKDSLQPAYRVQTSLATFTVDRRQLLDTPRGFVDCQMNYQTLGSWKDWMGMGTTPGMISSRLVGTKCTVEQLPEYLVDRIGADHGGFF